MVISLSAKGLTHGEIAAHLAEVYGAEVSKQTITTITDRVMEGMAEWQNRLLDPVYAVLFIDAVNVKIREGQVASRPVYLALGVTVDGDNISRIRSEAAWAGLCGVAPIPASSGMTAGHRLNRGGHRQANAALYRTVIVRMQHHEPTRAYVARRIAEGKTEAEIICCLKRHLARETWALQRPLRQTTAAPPQAS